MIRDEELPALKSRMLTVLREELGLAHVGEEDGDLFGRYEGIEFMIQLDDRDAAYLWFRAHAHWFKDTDVGFDVVDRSANWVNYRCKAVKVNRMPDRDKDGDYMVMASCSHIVDDVKSLDPATVERYLSQLKLGITEFRQALAKETEQPAPPKALVAPASSARH